MRGRTICWRTIGLWGVVIYEERSHRSDNECRITSIKIRRDETALRGWCVGLPIAQSGKAVLSPANFIIITQTAVWIYMRPSRLPKQRIETRLSLPARLCAPRWIKNKKTVKPYLELPREAVMHAIMRWLLGIHGTTGVCRLCMIRVLVRVLLSWQLVGERLSICTDLYARPV